MTAAVAQVRVAADNTVRHQEQARHACETKFEEAALKAMARRAAQRSRQHS
jgi:hypothetical protein